MKRNVIHHVLSKSEIGIVRLLFLDQTEKSGGRFGHPDCDPLLHHKFPEALIEEASAIWRSILRLVYHVGIELSKLKRVGAGDECGGLENQ